jgi:heavy metal sensor kinase
VRRPRLSIGVRWTLRYTVALMVSVTALGLYTYSRIEQRTQRDARLVLELQAQDVIATMAQHGADSPEVRDAVDEAVTTTDGELKLGFQVFDARHRLVLASGSLAEHPAPFPTEAPTGAQWRWRTADLGDNYPYLLLTVESGGGFLQASLYTRRYVRNAYVVRDIYLYATPIMLLLTAGLGWLLARGSLRPLKAMNRTARRISATNLSESIPTTGARDELDELATTLNEMIGRIRHGMDRTRRFAANAAHELRTPLNALRSRLEVTLEQPRRPEEYQATLAEAAEEVALLSESVHALMRLARSEAGLAPEQRVPVDLSKLIADVVDFFEPLAEEAGVAVHVEPGAETTVPGDPSWLHQLFANLVHNAIKYTPSGGRVTVATRVGPDGVSVRVVDTGIGIPLDEQPRIFEPFERGGSGGKARGFGLGLALAREIARAHGGDVSVVSEPGQGSTFTVWLPAPSEEPASA